MQKFKFDARMGSIPDTTDFYTSPWKYSFVHNFKVHYKQSVIQALASKVDVSISSSNPQIPSTQQVMEEFNGRMQMGNVARNAVRRFSQVSYHVTNVEYKESFAFYDPQTAPRAPPTPTSTPVYVQPQSNPNFGALYCRNCGAKLLSDSKFCNRCGTPVIV